MIRIQRDRTDDNGVPIRPSSAWFEGAQAWTAIALAEKADHQARSAIYHADEPMAGQPAGKLDSFPLASEKTRAMGPSDDVERERRLLLDPTRDDPELHLTFNVKGRAVAIQPSRMGKTSIEVYHLNRKRLRSQREVRIRLVLDQIRELTEAGLAHSVALTLVTASLGKSKQAYAGTARAIRRDPTAFGLVAADVA